MPLYDIELMVSVTGSVQIEASDLEAARKLADKIEAYYLDVNLRGVGGADFTDMMSPDVEIDCISEAEPPEEVND
jgi:hypothetical protein